MSGCSSYLLLVPSCEMTDAQTEELLNCSRLCDGVDDGDGIEAGTPALCVLRRFCITRPRQLTRSSPIAPITSGERKSHMPVMQEYVHVVHNAYSPAEAVESAGRQGVYKANMRIDKMFISAVVAGMLLAFACAVSLSTQTAPWYQQNAPGLIRMIGAVIFPFGLVMIVVTGVDLCTGSFMVRSYLVRYVRQEIGSGN